MKNYLSLSKKIYLNEIDKKFKNQKIYIDKICSKENIKPNSLVFINKKKYNNEKIINDCLVLTNVNLKLKNIYFCKRPRLEFCKIIKKLIDNKILNKNFVVPKISNRSRISKKAVIENNVQIGSNTIIEPGAIIKENSIIGKNCVIRSGAVIGAISFSFERDRDKIYHFPTLGGVKIEDNVIIGSNSVISRANIGFTEIGKNTLIDTLVQIAHNCKIGKNITITGGSNIGGSVRIENNVMISPCSNLINNITIGKGSHIGIGSVVIKNVIKNSKVFGNPARKL